MNTINKMADGAMIYIGEKEDSDFALSGTSHVYNFTKTYTNVPKIIIDRYTGDKPTVTVAIDKVIIEGVDGDSGHLTVIEQ